MSGGGRIGDLVRKLDAMASPQWREDLNRRLGEEAVKQYRADFAKQQDPYGTTWARGKKKSGKTNIKSGYMRASGEVDSVGADGFRLKIYAPYARFRHDGTSVAPSTLLVPVSSRGLGTWGAPFTKIAAASIRGLLK